MDTHSLERTSPKGGLFVGRCVKCGKTDLPSSAVHEECPNPSGATQAQDILNAVEGNQPSACPADTEPSAEARAAAREVLPKDSFADFPLRDEALIAALEEKLREDFALALDRFRAVGVREWQPIATAPKDGTLILVSWAGSGMHPIISRWLKNAQTWTHPFNKPINLPTHWMPLPEPPHDL